IDCGHVALIIAVIARVASVNGIQVRGTVGRRERECGRALLIEALERRGLRPAAAQDLRAVGNLVFVDQAVETIAVDVLPVGIDRRRRRRVARTTGLVDPAGSGPVLPRPDLCTGLRIQGDDSSVLRRDEQQIFYALCSTYRLEKDGSAV